MSKFNIGDVVTLKSDRKIKMTIEKETFEGIYFCIWINRNRKYSDEFAEVLLEKWDDLPSLPIYLG